MEFTMIDGIYVLDVLISIASTMKHPEKKKHGVNSSGWGSSQSQAENDENRSPKNMFKNETRCIFSIS